MRFELALVRPPEPPLPITLNELAGATVPPMSSVAWVPVLPNVFWATIVSYRLDCSTDVFQTAAGAARWRPLFRAMVALTAGEVAEVRDAAAFA